MSDHFFFFTTKASSKERGGGGKVNFFFENLSLVPETREVMEHFKVHPGVSFYKKKF